MFTAGERVTVPLATNARPMRPTVVGTIISRGAGLPLTDQLGGYLVAVDDGNYKPLVVLARGCELTLADGGAA